MADVPLLALAALSAGLALAQWSRLPVCARVSLGAGAAFALAGIRHPGQSLQAVLAHTDGLAYVVALARGACAAVVMVSAVALLRGLLSRQP